MEENALTAKVKIQTEKSTDTSNFKITMSYMTALSITENLKIFSIAS